MRLLFGQFIIVRFMIVRFYDCAAPCVVPHHLLYPITSRVAHAGLTPILEAMVYSREGAPLLIVAPA